MSIYGTRLFGKVDAVPGIGHVATKCFHINYLPLIPTQGWLVTTQSGRGWRGMKIPISFKSYMVGWGRTLSFLAMIVGPFLLLFSIIDKHPDAGSIGASAAVTVIGIGAFVALKKVKFVNVASFDRACELAKLAKLPDSVLAQLAQAYGRPPVSYGFQPKMPVATAAATPPVIESIEPDPASDDLAQTEVTAQAAAPIRPLSESRRHG